jgi:hypothetical protein
VNQEKPSTDGPAASPAPATASAFSKLFGAGVVGWFLGVLGVLVFAWAQKNQGGFAATVIWTFSHGWIAFLIGLVVLIGYGIATGKSVARAALCYVLPACVLALMAGICLMIYPDSMLREELFTFLPLVFLFYVFGLLWLRMGEGGNSSPSFARATLPALIGGLVVLCFVTVPVFASDAFRYRDAFTLSMTKAGTQDGAFRFEGSLEIRKPGSYRFSAPRYVWGAGPSEDASEPETELGEFTWGAAGAPGPEATGVFPLQIVWRKGLPQSSAADAMPIEDSIYIDVHKGDEQDRVVYSLHASLAP